METSREREGYVVPVLIAFLVFLAVALGIAALAQLPGGGSRSTRERIERYFGGSVVTPQPQKLLATLRTSLRRAGRIFEASDYVARLEEELERVNLPFRGSEFLVLDLILAAGFALVAFAFGRGILTVLSAGAIGALGPWVVIRLHSRRRLAMFTSQLADALVTISGSLRAGHSFLQAMDMVSKEALPPLSEEFSRMLKDISLGTSTEDSLLRLASRVPSEDLNLAVTAILVQRQTGGNLAEVLDNIAYTIRERLKIKGEIRTLTIQGRLSGLIIGLLPLAIGGIMAIISPEYIRLLFSHPLGRLMVGYAVASEILGAFLIWRIVVIEV